MRLTTETKVFIGILLASILLIAGAILFLNKPAQAIEKSRLLPSDTITVGNKSAKVYLVEFSDFQCPSCLAVKPYVDAIIKQYKDKLIFGYRHFPLQKHIYAQMAAEASEAAGQQGKFWEMYEYLFSNQDKLSVDFIDSAWKELGLDQNKYQNALNSATYREKVLRDVRDGEEFGVNGTPTFFLNGRPLSLTSFDQLTEAVKKAVDESY